MAKPVVSFGAPTPLVILLSVALVALNASIKVARITVFLLCADRHTTGQLASPIVRCIDPADSHGLDFGKRILMDSPHTTSADLVTTPRLLDPSLGYLLANPPFDRTFHDLDPAILSNDASWHLTISLRMRRRG